MHDPADPIEFEEHRTAERVADAVASMVRPSMSDAADLAHNERQDGT